MLINSNLSNGADTLLLLTLTSILLRLVTFRQKRNKCPPGVKYGWRHVKCLLIVRGFISFHFPRKRKISHPKDISLHNPSFLLYNQFNKLEFVGVNDENFIYDWWHYGSWKNNCVPTAQTGFTE